MAAWPQACCYGTDGSGTDAIEYAIFSFLIILIIQMRSIVPRCIALVYVARALFHGAMTSKPHPVDFDSCRFLPVSEPVVEVRS